MTSVRSFIAFLALAIAVCPALGQISNPGSGVDAIARQAAADAAASVPPVCSVVPARDTYTGTVGTGAPCTPKVDNTRPTQVQAVTATTASDGTFTATFSPAFPSTPSYVHAEIGSSTNPFVCQIDMTNVTVSSASGKCFQVVTTTLPGTLLALNGLLVSPIAPTTAGLTVRVIARQ